MKKECAEAARPYTKELLAEHEIKKFSVHDMEQATFDDARGLLTSIQHELMALSERMGMQMILFTVRSTPESYGSPHIFYTDKHLSDFIEFTTKNSVADFSARMDRYVLSGVDDAVTNYNQEITRMKSRLAALIKQKLKEASLRPVRQLTYVNFKMNIMIPYRMLIKGWPLSKFCCPSDIGTRMEVQLCLTAWEMGTAYWHYMKKDEEYNVWLKEYHEGQLVQRVSSANDDSDGDTHRDIL
ncbi:uncharacterized protein LAESUDRAFT_759117 [Laetiporus sulphureus 93-53]|uniref:Uncharacterized protein n=1 Tax=Laetiporus sulphureus 93-53 TaxID=1314785 RepID=A0A165EAN2_9APHY|nr:uncharacterized protein LAESUDRAFT_759117 [Laetiporus sulphureus 93-53]KZT06603.1 hypothetical protein LAESUDRAFT_759117 [Laetiporus sulphureus 93-53]